MANDAREHRWLVVTTVMLLTTILPLYSACAIPAFGGVKTATTAPTPTWTPYPTWTPLPIALPAVPALWDNSVSQHWAGYTFVQRGVTGIRAQWREPTVTGKPGDELFIGIGIGGWGEAEQNLMQIGSFASVTSSGGERHGLWSETWPQHSAEFPPAGVAPGDQIFASIELVQEHPQTWHVLVVDVMTQAKIDTTIQFNSMQAYADFVIEDPKLTGSVGPPFYALPHFSPVRFSNMQVRASGDWITAEAIYGLNTIYMQNGEELTDTSPAQYAACTISRI